MKILFIAPIQIHANASAGAETINYYINEFSRMDNDIDVLAYSEGRYINNNIHYHIIPTQNKKTIKLAKLSKALGWIVWPQSRYLYKTNHCQRKDIFSVLNKMSHEGYSPDAIFFETTSAILLYNQVEEIFPKAVKIGGLHDFALQGSQRRAALEKNQLKLYIRKRYLKYAEINEVNALSKMDIICPQNKGNEAILRKYRELNNKKIVSIVPFYSTEYNHESTHNNDILFYGLMSRPENYMSALWFIDNVVPLLSDKYRFIVMGGKPPVELISKASDKIVVTGFISEDEVKKYFENSFCIVVPLLFGSGIKTKVLSALRCGLPVLSNDIGIEGIDVRKNIDYIHCELPKEYVDAIDYLSNDVNYKMVSNNSRNNISNIYDHRASASNLLFEITNIIK